MVAVSTFLTRSLRYDDTVYHWNHSTLPAILQIPAADQAFTAFLQRTINNNRDTIIRLGGRSIMLRIPLTFEVTPIAHFRTADDLYKAG